MRVLQIHNTYREYGGEDSVVSADREILTAAGHEVISLTSQNPRGRLQTAVALGVSPWNPLAYTRIRHAVGEYRPDVVHFHNIWFNLTGAALHGARRSKAPIVMTLHNYRMMCLNAELYRDNNPCTDCIGATALHGVRHRCYRESYIASAASAASISLHKVMSTWTQCVDHFLTLTEFSRLKFIAAGIDPGRISVRSNFVTDPGVRASRPSESVQVAYVGRVSEMKGVRILVDAWNLAQPQELELVIAGDGPMRADLMAIPSSSSIKYLGPLPPADAKRLISGARALIFPSLLFENQPMVLLEAMASGTPIIASGSGGVPETVDGGRGGWLIPAGDVHALADRLASLRNGSSINAMSKAARRIYEARYNPAIGLQSLEAVYTSLIMNSNPAN